jgi:2-amino-4-hydroxy-6-hydroxymethyldihydropteridine diphosphokinase
VEKTVNAFVGIGSNLGDREQNLEKSIALIENRIGKIINKGIVLETIPIDMDSEFKFLNTCIEIETSLCPISLLRELKKIELDLGRAIESKGKKLPRTIDLDILFYGNITYNSDELIIPHISYHLRDFVLRPLSSISENFIDFRKKLSIKQLIN